jgi:DNA-binding transcriptional LysR family regulator
LIRDVAAGKLDLALLYCPPEVDGLATSPVDGPAAIVHARDDHPLAASGLISLGELRDETFLVAGGRDSDGYTAAVVAACRAAGFEPATRPDPYPDLGIQAVREGLGIVLYAPSGFPAQLEGTVLLRVEPEVRLPFVLAWRDAAADTRIQMLLEHGSDPDA